MKKRLMIINVVYLPFPEGSNRSVSDPDHA